MSLVAQVQAAPFPGTTPGTEIGGGLSTNYEPSGAAWHPTQNKLFVCGDDGKISRLNADGTGVTNWSLAGNWEGIAVAQPSSNFVYVANEDTGIIREFNWSTGADARTFNLTTATAGIGITPLSAADIDALTDDGDNTGVESLTFVPDPMDAEGGLFWAGSQQNGNIYKFRLSLSASNTVTYLGKIKPTGTGNDLSGLEYDWVNGSILAVWDANNVIRALDKSGNILNTWDVPAGSNDEEGIAFDGVSKLFLAEDPAPASEVWRYENFPITPVPEPTGAAVMGMGAVCLLLWRRAIQ